MGVWKECTIGDVITLQRGFDITKKEQAFGPIPVVSSSGVNSFHDTYKVEAPGVVIGRKGTLGTVFYLSENFWPHDTTLWVKDFKGNYPRFIYYFIKTVEVSIHDVGSSNPTLNRNHVHLLPCKLPPIHEQKAIAEVLSSLDDKIDLLHRQNKTLEQMAETLFRQWFVEEAEDDWEEGTLGDVIELIYGKGLKKEERTGNGFPVIGSSGIVDYHSGFLVDGPGIVIGRKGTLGKVTYLWDNFYPIDTTYYVKSKINSVGLFYEYFLLKTINFEEMNTDSAVPGLNRDIALSTEIRIVPEKLLHEFNELVSDFVNKIKTNKDQISILENTRNTILPKLMNGEIRVVNE